MANESQPELPLDERLRLARAAYREQWARCFWFMKKDLEVTEEYLPTVAKYLALHGGREGWLLAATICPSHLSR